MRLKQNFSMLICLLPGQSLLYDIVFDNVSPLLFHLSIYIYFMIFTVAKGTKRGAAAKRILSHFLHGLWAPVMSETAAGPAGC